MPKRMLDSLQERPRLGREIAIALAFKAVLLTALWFAVFRPDPRQPKPQVSDLFQPKPIPSIHQEKTHDVR